VIGDDAAWSAGSDGYVAIIASATSEQSRDYVFSHCTYKLAAGPVSGTWAAFKMDGSQRTLIQGCDIDNESIGTAVECTSSIQIFGGWTDPGGTEVDGTSRSRNHQWLSNRSIGSQGVILKEGGFTSADVGRMVYANNQIDEYSVFGAQSHFEASNMIAKAGAIGTGFDLVSGHACEPDHVMRFVAPGVRAGVTVNAERVGGATRYYTHRTHLLLTIWFNSGNAAHAGDSITLTIKRNGSAILAGISTVVSAGSQSLRIDTKPATDRVGVDADYYELEVAGGNSLTTLSDCEIEIGLMHVE